MQASLSDMQGITFDSLKFVWRQSKLAFFGAVTSVAALLFFRKENLMEFTFFIIPIAVICLGLYINHKIAKAFEQIVFAKGYGTELNAYYMCFWLGIVGYLYVIALPNKRLDNLTLKQHKKMLELLNNSPSTSNVFENTDEESD